MLIVSCEQIEIDFKTLIIIRTWTKRSGALVIKQMIKQTLIFSILLFFAEMVLSQELELPEEELAKETVLPIFDKNLSVLNRNIVTEDRFELGGYGGLVLIDPIYNQNIFGASVGYHFNEIHAAQLMAIMWSGGLGQYQSAYEEKGVYFSGTPGPETMFLANYQYTAFYGKMSVSKHFVMNTALFGVLGGGFITLRGGSLPVINFGLGEKFYFTKNFGLRVDLRFLFYQGPNPITGGESVQPSSPSSSPPPQQAAGDFKSHMIFSSQLTFGLIFLL